MPQYDVTIPGRGTFRVDSPFELTDAQAYSIAEQQTAAAPGKGPESGGGAAFRAGVEQLGGGISALMGRLGIKDVEQAEQEYQAAQKRAAEIFKPTEKGWTEAPGTKLAELFMGSVPYMAAPLAAGAAAAALPVTGPAALALGLGAAGATSAAQFTATNLSRQLEDGRKLAATDLGAAALASIPQAVLDTVSMALLPGVGKLFGSAGVKLTEKTAKELIEQSLRKTAIDYAASTGKAITREGLTEAAQQLPERLQAGLSITDPEAQKEYFDSFIGGAVLGGALAPAGRFVERGGEKREARALLQKAEADRTAEQRAAQAATEAQRKLAEAQQVTGTLFPETAPEGPAAPPGVTADPAERLAQVEEALAQKVASVRSGTPLSEEDRAELSQLQKERNALAAQVEETAPPAEAPTEATRRIMLLEQAIEAQQEQMQGATPEQTLVLQPRIQKLRDALAAAKEEAGVPSKSASELQMQTLPLYKQAKAIETRMRNAQEQGDEVVAAKQAQKLLDIRQQIADIEAPRRKAKEFEAAQEARTAPIQEGLFSPENIAAEQGRRDVREAEIQTELQQQQADIEAQQRAPEADIGADLFARMGEAEEAAAEAKDTAESKRLYEQMSTARDQREMFPSKEEGIEPITRMMGVEPTRPKQLQTLLDRAKAAPNVDDATRALIDRVDAELPALQKATPVATPAGTKPVEYVSPTGKAVAAPAAARRAPLMDVAAFLSRVAQGRDASAEAAQVQNHLARLEEGKRSETEQRTQYAPRALTAEEKQAVQGTALAGREDVMTRAPSGEIARGVQTEMPFEEGKSPAARERAVAFESFEEFDKFLAGDALQILRNAMKLSGETASRLMQALGPKMQELAQLRAKLLPLVERQRALRAAATQEKEAGKSLLKETDAEVTRLYLEAHMAIADLYAKRDAAVKALAAAQAQSAQLTAQIQENATALQAKIAQQPSLDAAVREKEQIVQTALVKIEEITARLQKLEADPAVQFESSLDKDWSEHSEDTVKYLAVRKAIRIAKEELRKAGAAYNAARTSLLDLQTGVSQRAYATPPALSALVEESMALDAKLTQERTNIRKRIGGLTTARNRAVDTLATVQAQVRDIPEFKEALDNALQERATAEQLKLEADADAAKTEAQAEALNSEADALRNAVNTLARDVEAAQQSIPVRARREAAARMPQETLAEREAQDAEKRREEQARLEQRATEPRTRVTFEKTPEASLFPDEYVKALERMYDTGLSNEERMVAAKEADKYLEQLLASKEKKQAEQAKALKMLTERRAEKLALIKDLKENYPGRVEALAREQKILENTEARLAALRKATKTLVGEERPVKPAREGEVEEIAATQRQRRATSPVTREVSSAPSQLRTGTPESRAGESRVGTAKRPFESTKAVERDTAISKSEQQSANALAEGMRERAKAANEAAEALRKQPPEQKRKAVEKARKEAKTLTEEAQAARIKRVRKAAKGAAKAFAKEEGDKGASKAVERTAKAAREAEIDEYDDYDVEILTGHGPEEDVFLREDNEFYAPPPSTDLSAEVEAAARDGRVIDALDGLETKGSTPFVRELAARLKPLLLRTKLAVEKDVKLDGTPVAGKYNASENKAYVDEAALTEETLLHELVHPATLRALYADAADLTTEQLAAREEVQKIFNEVKEDKALKDEYGKKNIDEFVAEVMSNPNLRNKLDSTGNLLQRLYRAFLRLIGLPQQTVSEQAVENIYKLFQPSRVMTTGPNVAGVASVMRGVFPATKPVSMPGIPADISSIVSRTVGRNATIGDKLAALTSGLYWRTAMADHWAPAEALVKRGVAQGKIDEVRALQSRIHMRLHEQVTQYIETAALNGVPQLVKQPDGTFLVEGKAGANLRQMAEALSKANIGNEQYTEQVFTTWLAILRAEKDGVGYDKLNFKKPITASEAKALKDFVANNATAKNAFEEARTLYKEYNRNLLNLLVDASVMSREKADELLKGDYVPYYRERNGVVELVVGNSKPVQIGNVIDQPYLKELVGGQEQILPFFSGAMQNTSMLVRMALRNLQTKDMAYLLEDLGLLVKRGKEADKQIAIHKGDGPAGLRVIHFKYKGENYWAELNPDVFPKDIPADLMISGMQGIKTAIPWLVKIMGMPANWLRKTVTRMPLYALRQTIRDPLHAWMTTGGDFAPIISSYKELGKMVAGKSETEEMLKRAAVISSNVYTGDPQDAARILRDIMTGKNWWNASMEKLDNFALQGDAATRAVLYNTYREKGMSHAQALLGTLESMNFSRRGTSASMHWLSTMIPFFNAQIQGLDAVYRAAKGDTVFENKMDARAKLLKRGALVTAATIAYALMMEDDEAYKNATPEERAMNWFVRVPGLEEAVRVPIPFELGLAFKTLPELMINTAFGDTKAEEAVKALGKQLWMSSPLSLPTAIKAPVELMANYSFYSDQPIESSRERNLTVDQRYRQNTTELAKILGKAGIVSPIQIEHFVRSYTSGAGVLLMSLLNPVLRPLSAEADVEKPDRKLSELPVIGGLFQPNTGRGLVNAAFDEVERYQQAARTYKELATRNLEEARAYAERYAREIALASTGGAFRQMMGEFAKLKRQIVSSKLPPEEKQERIERIKQQEIKLSQKLREMANA